MKNSRYFIYLTFSLLLSTVSAVEADISLPTLFGDHMVLQQKKAVPVWGWAEPGEEVRVEDQGLSKKTPFE